MKCNIKYGSILPPCLCIVAETDEEAFALHVFYNNSAKMRVHSSFVLDLPGIRGLTFEKNEEGYVE